MRSEGLEADEVASWRRRSAAGRRGRPRAGGNTVDAWQAVRQCKMLLTVQAALELYRGPCADDDGPFNPAADAAALAAAQAAASW